METLTIEQMELSGGARGEVDWDRVALIGCGIWGMGRVLKILAFTNPIAACVAMGLDIACGALGLATAIAP